MKENNYSLVNGCQSKKKKKKDRTNKRRKERENEKVGGYCIRIDRFLECHYVQLRYIHIFSELAYNNPKGSTTT